jgi:type VI secretion system protein ImpA
MMTTLPSKRQEIDEAILIAPLSEGDGVGKYLRYDPLYDQIKEARREDDVTLSQGIWQTEIKRADWVSVETLCLDAISTKTKDLQILSWLIESWTVLDGLEGTIRGFKILNSVIQTFWVNLHPAPENDDIEYRLRIFDWINEFIANRLMFIPLTNVQVDQEGFNLADWSAAVSLETIVKRSSEGKALLAEAEASGKITLTRFRKSLTRTPLSFIKTIYAQLLETTQTLEDFRTYLEQVCGAQAPTFSRIRTYLDDMARICKTSLDQRPAQDESENQNESTKNEQVSSTDNINELLKDETNVSIQANISSQDSAEDDMVTVSERKHAYQALRDISHFLKGLDPHSPAPYLVDLIVTWENKNMVEILTDIAEGSTESHRLLRVLANATLPAANVPPK